MTPLDALLKYFPTGTTEGELDVLERVFIAPSQMADVLSAPPGSPRLMVGTKGVGKSAILDRILRSCHDGQIPALLLRPDDIDLSPVANAKDIATLKRQMYSCLLVAVGSSLGKLTNGLLTGDAAELHKLAVRTGVKKKDFVERLLPVLGALATPVAGIDVGKLASSFASGPGGPLLPAVSGYLLAASSVALLLIDDTDQLASPDDPEQLNRLWAFLLAVRRLSQEVPSIHPIVSLRSEVWLRLQRDERGQRDQIDHFRPLVVDLRARDEHLERILIRRLECAATEIGSAWIHFFENPEVVLPRSTETRPWQGFIKKSSRERPRDVIQLVNKLATNAKQRGARKIGSVDAEQAMHTYSKERITDLATEVGKDCQVFEEVARTFAGRSFEMAFHELREHMLTIPTRFSVSIRGVTSQANDNESFVRLLNVMFEAGFINARVPDPTMAKQFRHIMYPDDPNLASLARWSDLQATKWEIHPAFRTWLLDVRSAIPHRR